MRGLKSLIPVALYTILFLLLTISGQQHYWGDEGDNWLGGYRIAQGDVLYKDYWSHHLPAPYYIAATLVKITQSHDISLLRFSWSTAVFILWVVLGWYLKQTLGIKNVAIVGLITSLGIIIFHAGSLLTETVVFYSTITAYLILVYKIREGNTSFSNCFIVITCITVIMLSSLAYWLLGFTLFVTLCFFYRTKRMLLAKALLIPVLIMLVYLVSSNNLQEMFEQVYYFNSHYYSPYVNSPTNIFGVLLQVPLSWLRAIIFPQEIIDTRVFLFWAFNLLLLIYYCYRRQWNLLALYLLVLIGTFDYRSHFYNERSHMLPHLLLIGTQLGLVLSTADRRKNFTLYSLKVIMVTMIATLVLVFGIMLLNNPQAFRNKIKYQIIETLIESDDYIWVGPYGFYEMLSFGNPAASSVQFYLPWQADSPEVTQLLISDLERNTPMVIIFDNYIVAERYYPYEYANELVRWINQNYHEIEPAVYLRNQS